MKIDEKNESAEWALFRETVGEVRPLKHKEKIVNKCKDDTKNFRTALKHHIETEELDFLPLSDSYTTTFNAEKEVAYLAPGEHLSPDLAQKIQRGQYPKDKIMDLHGDTVDSARSRFSAFLQQARKDGCQGVFIVHGKGKNAILKNHVIHWLKQVPWVLYFCSAIPAEGGTGALYILLKKNKKNGVDSSTLADVREIIDQLDVKINRLLCQRFHYAKKAAVLKKTTSIDVEREQKILRRMSNLAFQSSIPPEHMEAIYRIVLMEMKQFQQNQKTIS